MFSYICINKNIKNEKRSRTWIKDTSLFKRKRS